MRNWLRKRRDDLVARIGSQLDHRLPARRTDSFDLIDVAWADAAIDSARYYSAEMLKAQCFSDDNSLRHFSISRKRSEGLVLEFGVASGRTTNQIARAVAPTKIYGFDGFTGLPEDWSPEFRCGAFKQALPRVEPNVELVIGMFEETLPMFLERRDGQVVSFLHVDCDLYSSTKTIFEHLGTRIVSGTVIMFDEYFNYPGWRDHEYKAFQEFVTSRSLEYSYIGFNRYHQQVTVVIA